MAKDAARMLIDAHAHEIRAAATGTKIEGYVEIGGRVLKVTAGVDSVGQISDGGIRVVR